MKTAAINIGIVVLIIGLSIWLYADDKAAEPGALSSAHAAFTDCETCHVPWRGVTDQMCLQCHYFNDVSMLRPQIRFHEAQQHCLDCHTEHRGYAGDISEVDHTLFSGELACTQCHFDAHDGRFGEDCRACHNIKTWQIKGFRHPPADNQNCHRCHSAPASHTNAAFWGQIEKGHRQSKYEKDRPSVNECWRCHTIHRWGHMVMEHGL